MQGIQGREQMLLATKDEAGVHLDEEENDFMHDNAYGDNTLEELNATMIMMARIQPTDDKSDAKPTYDDEFISEVNASQIDMVNGLFSKSDHEQQHLKKAIEAQPKMYDGEKLESNKLKVDLPHYEETLKDAEKSRLKMKDKMIQLDYSKLNALYESFVPQTEIPVEKTYFLSPLTSNVSFESRLKKLDVPPKKMPNESKLLKLFVNLDKKIKELGKLSNINLKMDQDKTFQYENRTGIRRLFTQEVVPILDTLKECSTTIKQEITEEVREMLEIFESMERKVEETSQKDELIQNEIDRLLEASLEREIRDCVLISVVVRAKNQNLLMIISELKDKLKTVEKGKNVNTKLRVSKVEVKSDNLKMVTSCSTPKNEQGVASSSSVRRPESKDTNSKKRALLNTKSKSTYKDVKKSQSSVSLVSNKRDTMNLNVSESNANGAENHYMVTLVNGVLASGVVMIFEMDIASYAIQGTKILSRTTAIPFHFMIQTLNSFDNPTPIFYITHPHIPQYVHTLVKFMWERFHIRKWLSFSFMKRQMVLLSLAWSETISENGDDDEEYNPLQSNHTLFYQTKEPVDSPIMEDGSSPSTHLSNIIRTKVIKSSDEDLVPIQVKSEGDDILREKLSKINLLIAKIERINYNPPPSSDFMTKSSSTSLNFFLEEANAFDNSIPKSKTFLPHNKTSALDLIRDSMAVTLLRFDDTLPDYKLLF
ncbi:hypothetical protein Tco_0080597 [Tanacetum coccineum]